MLVREKGACSGSDYYFLTPSALARELLYHMPSCGYFYTNYDYRIEREDYHSYMLFYICDGRLSVTNEGKTQVAEAGQAGFINCHVPHEYHTIGNTEFVWLHLDGAETAGFYRAVSERNGGFLLPPGPVAEHVREGIYRIVYACRNEQTPTEPALSGQIYKILLGLLGKVRDTDGGDCPPCETAMQYIRAHYSEKITLEDLARLVSMSQYHFARMFKRSCGYSPHEFLILTRLNRAKHLLKTTDLPVKVIAQNVGYPSVTTFTNAFSSRVGLSPSLFRKYPI